MRWRLWSTLTSLLQSYVTKTNDVTQQDNGSIEENSFGAILRSLAYPLRWIDLSALQEGTLNELLKVWRDLLQAFTRGLSLLSGAETNLAVESFFKSLRKHGIVKVVFLFFSYMLKFFKPFTLKYFHCNCEKQ